MGFLDSAFQGATRGLGIGMNLAQQERENKRADERLEMSRQSSLRESERHAWAEKGQREMENQKLVMKDIAQARSLMENPTANPVELNNALSRAMTRSEALGSYQVVHDPENNQYKVIGTDVLNMKINEKEFSPEEMKGVMQQAMANADPVSFINNGLAAERAIEKFNTKQFLENKGNVVERADGSLAWETRIASATDRDENNNPIMKTIQQPLKENDPRARKFLEAKEDRTTKQARQKADLEYREAATKKLQERPEVAKETSKKEMALQKMNVDSALKKHEASYLRRGFTPMGGHMYDPESASPSLQYLRERENIINLGFGRTKEDQKEMSAEDKLKSLFPDTEVARATEDRAKGIGKVKGTRDKKSKSDKTAEKLYPPKKTADKPKLYPPKTRPSLSNRYNPLQGVQGRGYGISDKQSK